MKYIVERSTPNAVANTAPFIKKPAAEVEATGFKIERGIAIFFREKKMSGIVGTGLETTLIAAFSDFLSVREKEEA